MPRSESQINGHYLSARDSNHDVTNHLEINTQLEPKSEDPVPSRAASQSSSQSLKEVISFVPNDSEHPHNWSTRRKSFVVLTGIVLVLNSTVGSSIASGASQEFATYFHITSQEQLVLPTSVYLVGYVLGPLAFGPLSESYGRKWVMISTFVREFVFEKRLTALMLRL